MNTSFRGLPLALLMMAVIMLTSSCLRYSFTGASIPPDVRTIYIPFFPDRSSSGVGTLGDLLYKELVDRFVNQSRLTLVNSMDQADAWIDGEITSYRNAAFSLAGDEQTSRNQVTITVRGLFKYASEDKPVWSAPVSGSATYDVLNDPVNGELEAIEDALEQIANTMFTNSVSQW
jgi:hypothetical protein